MNKNRILAFMGVELNPSSHLEKIISGLGAFIAIAMIYVLSSAIVGKEAYLIVASMGAASVLLFAVPHGMLSQPWPLLGGNLISALVGVSCAMMIPDLVLASAAAVGVAITAMYYLKCLHPPGGATALVAVVGGEAVHSLGYWYVLAPVFINVMVMFLVAFLFNAMFQWRRYPASLAQKRNTDEHNADEVPEVIQNMVSHQGVEYAMRKIDSFIDVNDDDLNRIYQLASDYDKGKTDHE